MLPGYPIHPDFDPFPGAGTQRGISKTNFYSTSAEIELQVVLLLFGPLTLQIYDVTQTGGGGCQCCHGLCQSIQIICIRSHLIIVKQHLEVLVPPHLFSNPQL